jgi:Ca2+-binding RTX toxin-like protein
VDCPDTSTTCFPWPTHVAVASNGDVYASYRTGAYDFHFPDASDPTGDNYIGDQQIVVVRSTDGGGMFSYVTPPFTTHLTTNVGSRFLDASFSWTLGAGQAFIVPDPQNPETIALVFNDDPTPSDDGPGFDDAGVFIARTTNAGGMWSTPLAVDSGPAGSLQLFPTAGWDLSSQCLSVAWYDGRRGFLDPTNHTNAAGSVLYDFMVRTSADGGQNFGPEVNVNDIEFDPDLNASDRVTAAGTRASKRVGEYNGVLMARGVTWTGNDPDEPNAAAKNQRVLFDLSDRVPPVFSFVPPPLPLTDCSTADIGMATATDECGLGPVVVNSNHAPDDVFPLGPTTVIWTAADGAKNSVDATQVVTVTDTTGPTFTLVPPDITTTTCTGLVLQQPTAEDSCGGNVTFTSNAPTKYPLGTTIVTWTALDARGNTRTATQRVTVLLGDNPSCCPAGTNIIQGNSNNNTLNGTSGSDCILGKGAQDTINGNGGNDFISGGDGNDIITGGLGNDVIFAGSGQDNVNGNDGNDAIDGGDGDDTVQGGAGDDILHGGQGQDSVQGQDGNDVLFGDTGDDTLQGGNGNDTLAGNGGNDHCDGGTGTNIFEQCEFGATNSCADLAQNGTETAIDCGGGCPACDEGLTCSAGSDCQSNVCSGTCQSIAGGIAVVPVVETDWGGGYCVHLNVTNTNSVPTTNWIASINTNQSTIYTTWMGNFSGSGTVTVTPALASNQVIDPSETDGSIGFCANRNVSGSGVLPFVVSASASY